MMSKLKISRVDITEGDFILGKSAWYDYEENYIKIWKHLKPFWLVLVHELGHYFIGFFPQTIHLKIALDYEWDNLWYKTCKTFLYIG